MRLENWKFWFHTWSDIRYWERYQLRSSVPRNHRRNTWNSSTTFKGKDSCQTKRPIPLAKIRKVLGQNKCLCPTKPNILFILADDMGATDAGYLGADLSTPNLDKLATEGLKLENYYVQQLCSPTRTQLLTGRYLIRYGLQKSIIRPTEPRGIPLRMVSNLALWLQLMLDLITN